MGSERIPRDEQIRLIQECRNSGMSDSQWCLQHGIRPGTFYNWVNRIKKKGDIHIPSPGGTGEYFPEAKQDIVRINLVREDGGAITKPEEPERRIAVPDTCPRIRVRVYRNAVMLSCCHQPERTNNFFY